ncbi:hypothetical protein CYMTET_23239 [Cymbomonas tetramitiformis]|uniref:Uncharacterized protein n=1 Tax=Cymbomonas tetramitiformis TaxID=36881 RepID=A0AAE0L1B1_9CHLO|nr:hypothetical protein CYMTET_23239 [Cymbomonas tetramitiformis]
MPYPQQFIDNEPPFEPSFMDNMSVQLGFNEPEQKVSANSFTPLPPWISSAHDSAVVIETDSEDEDVHGEAEPPPAPRVGGVRPPGVGTWLISAAVPALFMCLSMCIMDTVAGSGLGIEIAPQSVVYGDYHCYHNGTVDFVDTAFLDAGTADLNDNFFLNPGVIGFDTAGIYSLPDSIDNCNFNSELLSLDHKVAKYICTLLVAPLDL